MFCPNCGNDCQNANFCSNCGYDLRNINQISCTEHDTQLMTPINTAPDDLLGVYGNDFRYMRLEKTSVSFIELDTGESNCIPYNEISKVSMMRASPQKTGFLFCRNFDNIDSLDTVYGSVQSDPLSISYDVTENARVYNAFLFLKKCASENTAKNSINSEMSDPAKEMIAAATQARAYENEKGYVSAQTLAANPDAFVLDNSMWYPGKKKHDRKERIRELEKSGEVYCPKCLSTKITANQKGFGFVRGALGANLGLDVGLIAGGIGAKKVVCTCLKCGYQWKAGKK